MFTKIILLANNKIKMTKQINTYTVSQMESMIFRQFFCGLKMICETEREKRALNLVVRRYMNRLHRGKRDNIHDIIQFILRFDNWSMEKLGGIWEDSIQTTGVLLTRNTNNKRQLPTCVICSERNVDVYFLHESCVHTCVCSKCAYTLLCSTHDSKCPICRIYIERVIFIPENRSQCMCYKKCKSLLIVGKEYLMEATECTVPPSMEKDKRYVIY